MRFLQRIRFQKYRKRLDKVFLEELKFRKIPLWRSSQVFFGLAVFSLPLQIRSLIYARNAYELNFFNEHIAFFVYLSEIFFLLAFVFLGLALFFGERVDLQWKGLRRFASPVLAFLGVTVLAILMARDGPLALLHFWRILILFGAAIYLAVGAIDRYLIIKILAASFFLQAILGIAQYTAGGSIGLHFLGESIFTAKSFGIGKVVLPDGSVAVRGMGTLAHANILGGLSALVLFLLASDKRKTALEYFAVVVILVGMFFSFSRGAFLAFFTGLLLLTLFQFKRRLVSSMAAALIFALLILFFGSPFFVHLGGNGDTIGRMDQIGQAFEVVGENWLGAGRGSYTLALAETNPGLESWELQPVHNFFVLKFAEESLIVALGWLGIIVGLGFWCYREEKYEALVLLIGLFLLLNFDHYFATSYAGEAMLFLVFGFVLSDLNNKRVQAT